MLRQKSSSPKIGKLDFLNPRAKLSVVNTIFTEVAPTYALVTRMLSFGRDQAWKRLLLRQLPEIKKAQCLDLACGTGDLTLALAQKYPQGKVIGLDFNPEMLALARKREAPKNIAWLQKDMTHTGFAAARFDIVTGGYALRNAPRLEEALQEIHRVLKPGGYGAFLDFSKSQNPWIQAMSLFCLRLWGSVWGILLHGNPDIYAYIAASLGHFPDRNALKKLFSQTGFKQINTRSLFWGFVEIVTFRR